jgi:hypothetical protein
MAAELDTHTADGQTESKLTQRGRRTVRPTYRSSALEVFRIARSTRQVGLHADKTPISCQKKKNPTGYSADSPCRRQYVLS